MANEEPSDEMLMRLADGELEEPVATGLRARIAADPGLAARFAAFERTRRAAADAFAGIAAQPVPDRLIAAVLAADAATRRAAPRVAPAAAPPAAPPWATRPARPVRRFIPLALAASVAALIALPAGYMLGRGGEGDVLRDPLRGGAGLVAAALETTASGERRSAGGLSVRPLASHRVAGGVCRDFLLEPAAGATTAPVLGVACRDGAGWVLRASVTLQGGDALRTASADHPVIAAVLEGLGAAPPLDPDSEAALLRQGWR
jgi:anti-sigma factor RsiW